MTVVCLSAVARAPVIRGYPKPLKHLHLASRASLVVAPGLLQNADGQIDKVIWTSTLPAPRNLMGSTAQLSVLQTAGVVEGVVSGYKP